MMNLLPEEEKKTARKEYYVRLGITGGVLLFVGLLSFATLLGTFYVIVREEEKTLLEAASNLEQLDEISENRKILASLSEKLPILDTKEEVLLTSVLETIVKIKNDGIVIQEILYQEENEGPKIRISGNTESRGDMVSFVGDLEQEETFTNIDSPLSNLSKNVDIDFSITLTLKNNEDKKK